MANDAVTTAVVTGKVRFSYAHVFEPSSIDNNPESAKYSVSLIIPKRDKKTLATIKTIIDRLAGEWMVKNNKKVLPAGFKMPLRDGDEERSEDESYEDSFFVNASSKKQPGIVKKGAMGLEKITDEEDFYSGCYGKADINFYIFDKAGNKGIACGLNNLLKLEDGDSLSGGRSATAAFADEADDLM